MKTSLDNQKPYSHFQQRDSHMLETLQLQTFDYFVKNFNPNNNHGFMLAGYFMFLQLELWLIYNLIDEVKRKLKNS